MTPPIAPDLKFDPTTGHLPPGRTRVSFDEAAAFLVDHHQFRASSTRRRLWAGLSEYLARFAALEARYEDRLAGRPLLHYLWLGGSFVSPEIDPRNIDVTVCVDGDARSRLRGLPGSAWLNRAFDRDSMESRHGLSPLALQYFPVASVFRMHRLDRSQLTYLQQRGGWDDWWQRCRDPKAESQEPTEATAAPRRGYLEVTL